MPGHISHVGLAIFNHSRYPTQWVLVLSANEFFQGRVLCSTVSTTVNGWQEIWTECEYSPASFNRSATFVGVIHIAQLTESMEHVYYEIRYKGMVSANPAQTDRYVLQALGRIGNAYFGAPSLLSREKELYEVIKARIPLLNRFPRTNSPFPVTSLSPEGVRVGKARWH
jgi:hypothetical protein